MKINYKPIKDITVGNEILGDSSSVEVSDAYEAHTPEEMYSIEFEDGFVVECSGNHLWYCETEEDGQRKDSYRALLNGLKNFIPDKLKKDEIYTKRELIYKIADENFIISLLITYLLDTLGPSYQSPHMEFDGLEPTSLSMEYQYSYNDLIDLWGKQSDEANYFYFGKTRTTKEIFQYKGIINIPTRQDIKGTSL